MKKLSFWFILTVITGASNIICKENDPSSIWQTIKQFNTSLNRKAVNITLTKDDWSEYRNNRIKKENLFQALIYAEKTCECKNFPTHCQEILLKPLVVAYIEAALQQEELASIVYFSPHDRAKHTEYINYLKEQKEHFNPRMQAVREC